jgi:hypothetical protein
MNIQISFLGNAAMNKIMCPSTIKKNDDLPMLNVANYLEGLGAKNPMREFREMTGSTSGGSEGGVMSLGSVDMATRGSSTSSSEASFEMAIKKLCSLHLCP